jgi:hypothetical protein
MKGHRSMPHRFKSFGLCLLALGAHACAPDASNVPLPADVIGFAPGEDFKLSNYGPIAEYFEALAASTDRMVLEQIGESTLGEPLYLAAISTPENLALLDRYKEITRTLANARDPNGGYGTILSEEDARALAQEGKAIVWIDGGLHATEVAHGQVMPEMAHHFVTDESAETQNIRENTILLLMANMNPDGLNIVADWYMSNVGGEFEMASVPELYHHYIGHDNNRDWYMLTQIETQAVTRQLYHNWFPQIVYNQHQSGPFPGRIWMPPFADPVSPNLDPLLVSSLNQMGHSMRKRFDFENSGGTDPCGAAPTTTTCWAFSRRRRGRATRHRGVTTRSPRRLARAGLICRRRPRRPATTTRGSVAVGIFATPWTT